MTNTLTAPSWNELEGLLWQEVAGGVEPRLRLRTGTRIDVGRWFRSNPVWLCVTASEVILLAVGRRRYAERVPISGCTASAYSHASGELVLSPAEGLRFKHLRMKPTEALKVLACLPSPVKSSINPT